jgi:hypothetical protein
MADVTELQKQIEEKRAEAEKASQEAERLQDQLDTARVESFSETSVKEAEELGINPRNFDTEDNLRLAIDRVNADKPAEEPEEEDQNGEG